VATDFVDIKEVSAEIKGDIEGVDGGITQGFCGECQIELALLFLCGPEAS
jgi:hypothetical protein